MLLKHGACEVSQQRDLTVLDAPIVVLLHLLCTVYRYCSPSCDQ